MKDASHYKSTSLDESDVSSLAIVMSIVVPETTNSVKESKDLKNRKHKNSEAKHCVDSH